MTSRCRSVSLASSTSRSISPSRLAMWGGVTQRGEWPKDPVPPAMALPGPGGDDEHPPFRLRDDAVLAERIFERVLKRVRSILRTCTQGDQRAVDLRVRRFACEQPLRASETLGNLPHKRHLHVLKCRWSSESFSRRSGLCLAA